METTEKIAFLYLRFNGFFLMPYFTVFGVEKGRHLDVLGIRLAGSEEKVGENLLSRDEEFINRLRGYEEDTILWAEVGTGSRRDLFPERKEAYCKRIFGGKDQLKKVYFDFDKQQEDLVYKDGILIVPAGRCRKIILDRFSQMESEPVKNKLNEMTKTGSWKWSEDFLADLLCLRKTGFLKSNT